jgi:hypothetical protein
MTRAGRLSQRYHESMSPLPHNNGRSRGLLQDPKINHLRARVSIRLLIQSFELRLPNTQQLGGVLVPPSSSSCSYADACASYEVYTERPGAGE